MQLGNSHPNDPAPKLPKNGETNLCEFLRILTILQNKRILTNFLNQKSLVFELCA